MSKKLKWALVIGLATAGIGAGTTYAATNGNDQQVISKAAVSGDVKMERGAKKEIRFQMKDQTELLNLLKLDEQALRDKREAGQSLAEIAEAQGVTRQQLIDVLTKQHETQLAKAVEAGKMTQEQADTMKGMFPNVVAKMIEDKGHGFFIKGDFMHGDGMKKGFRVEMADQTELLNLLKLDEQALRDKREAGQSLAEIAQAQGVTRQQLTDVLVKQHAAQLAKAVAAGKMTQEQADSLKGTFSGMVDKMIDAKGHGDFKMENGKGRFLFKGQTAE